MKILTKIQFRTLLATPDLSDHQGSPGLLTPDTARWLEVNVKNTSNNTTLKTSYPTTASPEDTIISEAQENDLKSESMKIIEALKEENKSLKEIQENAIKPEELNKTLQDLKMEIEVMKKTQSEAILETGNLWKRTRTTDTSVTNRIKRWKTESQVRKIRLKKSIHQSKKTLNLKSS